MDETDLKARLDRLSNAVSYLQTLTRAQLGREPTRQERTTRTRAINILAREARDLYRVNAGLPSLE